MFSIVIAALYLALVLLLISLKCTSGSKVSPTLNVALAVEQMALPAMPPVTVKTGTHHMCLPGSEFLRNPMVPESNTLETTGDT